LGTIGVSWVGLENNYASNFVHHDINVILINIFIRNDFYLLVILFGGAFYGNGWYKVNT